MRVAGLAWIGVLAACTGAARGQGTITYFWDINDTGSDTLLYSGEPVINFKMYGLMEPEQVGFAWSIYDILGGHEYADAGEVVGYVNYLNALSDDGALQGNGDILDIDSFQLPPFFGEHFDRNNPILLYEIDWEVTNFFDRVTLTSANHVRNDVYTDNWGTSETYEAITTTATVLIPSPATVVPMAGLLACFRRRRVG